MIKKITWTLMLLVTVGCSSPAFKTQFYTLNKQTKQTKLINNPEQLGLIVIENIHLADYLRQQGIVVKESGSRLQISTNHRWAEALDSSLVRNLRAELETNLDNYRVELVNSHWQIPAKLTIKVEVAQFEVDNSTQKIVHSGRYWIHDDKGGLIGQRRFNFELGLAENGFDHAVLRLQQSVMRLGELVSNDIKELTN